jgi:hypothetical protein
MATRTLPALGGTEYFAIKIPSQQAAQDHKKAKEQAKPHSESAWRPKRPEHIPTTLQAAPGPIAA